MLSHASRVSSQDSSANRLRPRRSLLRRTLPPLLALGALAACLPAGASAETVPTIPTSCTKYASPSGSDSAPGTAAAPLRSAQALSDALAAGQVGCLEAGAYGGGLRVNHGGAAGAPIVLRSNPGETALITGRVLIPQGSNYVTIADLSLDGNGQSGRQLPSPSIDAKHTAFVADNVTNDHTEICFSVGSAGWGAADSTVIADSHIHDCGLLPSRNEDHGIYVDDATNTLIVGNLIDRNADRGVQLFPNAVGTVITENVISENGEGIIFSGEGSTSSNDNTVEHNLIVKSLIRSDVESWYPSGTPLGVGNVVRNNCVSSRGISIGVGGFSASANVTASASELIATEEGGYRAAPGSSCASVFSATGFEGAPSGGAPTPVGKEAGGGTPSPTPEPPAGTAPTEAPGGAPTEAPTGGTGQPPTEAGGTPPPTHGPKHGHRRHHGHAAARHAHTRASAARRRH
ncbi:MAG TPA: right-handed parallel beta-helix repeat-containing protein [Solirubrobacteraceae bacterium]